MRLTPWFPADVEPVRPGWYLRRLYGWAPELPDFYDGKHWYFGGGDQNLSDVVKPKWRDDSGKWEWRGLAKESQT